MRAPLVRLLLVGVVGCAEPLQGTQIGAEDDSWGCEPVGDEIVDADATIVDGRSLSAHLADAAGPVAIDVVREDTGDVLSLGLALVADGPPIRHVWEPEPADAPTRCPDTYDLPVRVGLELAPWLAEDLAGTVSVWEAGGTRLAAGAPVDALQGTIAPDSAEHFYANATWADGGWAVGQLWFRRADGGEEVWARWPAAR